jgi:DNA-3-methyladenine glycosylase
MTSGLHSAFFDRDTRVVAQELLGCALVRDGVSVRIVETEAYIPGDSANHSYRGRTARNAPMWGPPGHLYVYLCYGIHHLLNLVTEADGRPAAVLIRGCTVVSGHETVRERRGGRLDLMGPGKVAQALGTDTSWSGRALGDGLHVVHGPPPEAVQAVPRVGIDFAEPVHRDALWRYIARDDDR